MKRILVVIGTRPEAIKLFPLVHALRASDVVDVQICTTGQHAEMAAGVLAFAKIAPDFALPPIAAGQPLNAVLSQIIARLDGVLDAAAPDWVVVQGDTTTTLAAALAGYARNLPVAHVEAGLRSGSMKSPWPEEGYRRAVSSLATLHFAPTESAAAALRAEQVPPEAVHVPGNTVIDALHWTLERLRSDPAIAGGVAPILGRFVGKRLVLVTAHRRESWGAGLANIAEALAILARREDIGIVIPQHPNPAARRALAALDGHPRVALIEPVDYPQFVRLLDAAELVLTDSGGVQEEAPALGTPVVVLRDVTERPEPLEAGTARLAGTVAQDIVSAVSDILDDPDARMRMAARHLPYGDGSAARRIAAILETAG